ncbi:PH domain-containing protein [Salisaeta longa]|uniref:PH domain-containing protein n=1 Tax=Salisaeta longa TaxID=503170 RepID=UPI0003B62928|nr:PH domain-containing protein [Salisaeta longa]
MPAAAPDIAEGRRLHPLTLLLRILASLPAVVLLLLPVLTGSSSNDPWLSLLMTGLYGLVALPAIIMRYLRLRYQITPQQIVIQRGVIRRQNRSIPVERVQNIQIERPLMARFFGLARVKIETAGGSSTEGVLEYVHIDEAQRIRQTIRSLQADGTAQPADDATDRRDLLYGMNTPRVLLSGAFRFSLLYIAVIFSVTQFFDPNQITAWLMQSRGWVQQVAEAAYASPALTALLTAGAAVLLGWTTGVVLHVNRFYGFRLWLDEDKLHKKHGLLAVTEGTIPLEKVQVLILETNPLMRAFGWYTLKVQTMGLDVEEEGHRVIAPFAQFADAVALAQRVHRFHLPEDFTSVSPITIRRRFVRYAGALVGLVGLGGWLWPLDWWHPAGVAAPWWLLALLPAAFGWAVLQYRYHAYTLSGRELYVRRGVLRQRLWVMPVSKFHVFYQTATVFQRRLNVANVFVDTAGASSAAYPDIIDLPQPVARALMEQLHARFAWYHQQLLVRRSARRALPAPASS